MMESEYFNPVKKIIKILNQNNYEGYIVGGYVRDHLLSKKKRNTEIDIATNATPKQLNQLFKYTKEVGQIFGVTLTVFEGLKFEIATFRTDSAASDGRRPDSVNFTTIDDDVLRRDLTINSLYLDITTGNILDFVEGKKI